jgi:hypothetical protein
MDDLVQRIGSIPGLEYVDTRANALQEIGNQVLRSARAAAGQAGIDDPRTR